MRRRNAGEDGSSEQRTGSNGADSALQAEKSASAEQDTVDGPAPVILTDPKFVIWFLTVPVVLLVAWAHTLGFI